MYKYVYQDHAWKAVVSPQEFLLHFKHIKEVVSEVCIARDCAKIAWETILKHWGHEAVDYINNITAYNLLTAI